MGGEAVAAGGPGSGPAARRLEGGVGSRTSTHVARFGRSESARVQSIEQQVWLGVCTTRGLWALRRASAWERGVLLEIFTIRSCFLYAIVGFDCVDRPLQDDGRLRGRSGLLMQLTPKGLTRIVLAQ